MVLGILVSSAALLARQKRVGFERHLILFATFSFLMAAEIFGAVAGMEWGTASPVAAGGMWVWYPILSSMGLLGMMLWFDYVRLDSAGADGRERGRLRRNSRGYLLAAAFLLAMGAYLSSVEYAPKGPPTSHHHLGHAAGVIHGAKVAAMLVLILKAHLMYGRWFSRSESRAFMIGCMAGLLGAIVRLSTGPREHFTTLAFTFFVAVFLRDNYRRSEREAVRASEDRSAETLLFHHITTQLKSTLDVPRLCRILMDSLVSNLGVEAGAIYMRNGNDPNFSPVLLYGNFPPPLRFPDPFPEDPGEAHRLLEQTPVPPGEGIIGRVAESGAPDYIYDTDEAAHHYPWPTGRVTVQTAIALPLRGSEGIYGAVQIVNRIGGTPFAEEDLRFVSLLVEQAGLAIDNAVQHAKAVERERTEEQIKIARQIQLGLIPTELPRIPGLAVAAEYRAAQDVGGDYFDYYRMDHDHLGILVFDVAGKGVPGALLMAITSTFLKMAAPRSNSPAWVLNEVNAALAAEMRPGLYVTAAYGVLKLSTLELTLCSAGHTDAVVIRDRDGSCEKHNPRGAALGLLRPNRFRAILEQETVQLRPGDTLLLYTDGVTEAVNDQGEEFGAARLCDAASRLAREGPRRLAAGICRAVRRHAGQNPQYDDITLVALRVGVDTPEMEAYLENP